MTKSTGNGRRGRPKRTSNGAEETPQTRPETGDNEGEFREPGTTGRYLVLMREDGMRAGIRALESVAGLNVANSTDFESGAVDPDTLEGAEAIVFDQLAVAVVNAPPDQIQMLGLESADDNPIIAVEPERVVYAIQEDGVYEETIISPPIITPPMPMPAPPMPGIAAGTNYIDYLRGYRDAVNHLVEKLLAAGGVADGSDEAMIAALDESVLTWGLQVTKAGASRYSGKGIRIAVLDTGMDLGHPDFAGRRIVSKSFITGQSVQDGHGHGTHCIGTACGPKRPGRLPRYGVAYNAEIFVGKVLSNQGSGGDAGILAGINWAITNRCRIVSMSLGARVRLGQTYSNIFEQVAQRALAAGTLIIAAAGNDSSRPSRTEPVSHPANCPSIMSVGALDQNLRMAYFSNGGLNPQGGQVDLAGPGVNVYSSWPRTRLYNTISGTSMATPHVAGIAALWAEARPALQGRGLWSVLTQNARRLTLPSRDVGTGLVQAP